MILLDGVNSSKNSTETYVILSQTCSRFNGILKQKKYALFPRIYMKFPERVFHSLPQFQDKVKVGIWKIMKTFVSYSGVATSLAEIVDDKKLKSAWLVINPGKHSWYIIERYYWKLNEKAIPFMEKKDLLDIIRFISITFTLRTRKSFDILRTSWTTTLWMRLKSQFVRS